MKSSYLLLWVLGVGVGNVSAQTGAAPRQLGAPPSVSPPARPIPPAPRQLDQVPASPPAATSAPVPDTARRASSLPPPAVPAAGYGTSRVAGAEGSLSGPGSRSGSRYQVGLKSGQVFSARDVNQKSPLFGRPFLLLDGRQRLELADVRFYEDETGHYVRDILPGTSREATLRRDQVGRLSLYSITTTQYSPGGYGMGGYCMGGYRTVKTEYFTKDNGPIQRLSHRNLTLATADNAGAQALVAKAGRYQTYTVLSYVAGGGLLVAGLIESARTAGTNNSRHFSPLVLVALPALVLPLVFRGRQTEAQKQAIALYNSGR